MYSKLKYLIQAIWKGFQRKEEKCLYCGNSLNQVTVVDRKYYFTKLVKCSSCALLVRTPTDSVEESNAFYQEQYTQGYTTDCPSPTELDHLLKVSFKGTERDYSRYIAFFDSLRIPRTARILDYGCSWGYGLYQLKSSGYDAIGYEISKPRLKFGIDKLGISGVSDVNDLPDQVDVFFSSHVLEHLPDLKFLFDLAQKKLKSDGYFIAITPNGSETFRRKRPINFHHLWGKVHPILLSDEFVNKNFKNNVKLLGGFPLDKQIEKHQESHVEVADKWELVFILQGQIN
jgi:2-polyprenyl-3-methyl-5-hydroxy-6-metoxy-1,4-benzoquinol methylase